MPETTLVTMNLRVLTEPSEPLDDLAARLRSVGHSTRLRIVACMHDGERRSPSGLAAELEESLGNVSYHVRELLKAGLVELVDTQPRRGAVEHYYALTTRGRRVLAGVQAFREARPA